MPFQVCLGVSVQSGGSVNECVAVWEFECVTECVSVLECVWVNVEESNVCEGVCILVSV